MEFSYCPWESLGFVEQDLNVGKGYRKLEVSENWRWKALFLLWLGLTVKVQMTDAAAKQCPGESWGGKIIEENPRFVSQDVSGERYEVGSAGDVLSVLHVHGSPFELGRAHGILLRSEIQSMYRRFFRYMEDEWISALHLTTWPETVARKIGRLALNMALDATYLLTLMYTPARFVDEMIGLSQGAQVDYQDVIRIQMVPELTRASCSILGSWGLGTCRSSTPGSLFQMRALDWDMKAPITDYHTVIYYYPADGNPFVSFTWAGFIGCVTGYSGRLGLSEKVWLGYNGTSNRKGMPWHFVLRDILQFTNNVDQAWSLLAATSRTCPILLGIGSREDDKMILVGYSSDTLELHDDKNFTMITSLIPNKNKLEGVLFVDKYKQPSEDECMSSLVTKYYRDLDVSALMHMVSRQQTGEMHTALYDFMANQVYFSWAGTNPQTGELVPAYKRNFVRFNMTSLFHPQPRCPPASFRRGVSCISCSAPPKLLRGNYRTA